MSILRFAIILLIGFGLGLPVYAQSFESKAPYAVIMDGETGIVLYEKNAREAIGPSSMTKIMTAEIVFSRLKDGSLTLDTEFPVSEKAWRKQGSKMFVRVGNAVRVEDLLRGIIIQSGNDACIVVAEGISGSEDQFAELMTRRAGELGLDSANFKNASGWPEEGHVMSVMDLAKLARHVIYSYPEFYALYSETEFTWAGIRQPNRNPVLGRVAGADGMKTGHTDDNGYGFVGTAERDGRRIIIVVNGLESQEDRRTESARLINAGFQSFTVIRPYKSGELIAKAPVWVGKDKTVDLIVKDDIELGAHKSSIKDMTMRAEFDSPVIAPVVKGQTLGQITISRPGMKDYSMPLIAAKDVARKGFIGRVFSGLGPLRSEFEMETK